ncbi:GYF domain-containing protein [Bradyrhizobium sp. ARR65]|uniref:GYF domain-containing protein n=1 Tax=Bradyrhizobium sp. ARR65 TaxID=1040989 RepID=UPI0004648428|nr:GYF domain-containing protein [Bradyrhizobium sp. ARR65]
MSAAFEQSWYMVQNDQPIGPIPEVAFRQLIAQGTVRSKDLVWRRGFSTWVLAEDVPEFAEANASRLKPPPLPNGSVVSSPPVQRQTPPPLPPRFATSNEAADNTGPTDQFELSAGAFDHNGQQLRSRAERTKDGSYLMRHWRGQLSLPTSYWFNGFLGYLASTLAVALVGASRALRTDYSPVLSLFSIVGTWTITLVVLCWLVVGAWRSATEYSKKGKILWAVAAKLSLCIAAICTLIQFGQRGLPGIREVYAIYSGDERIGKYSFRVLRDGAELEFSGAISFGASNEFARFVEAMGALKIVHLNSPGGRIEEAQRIGDMLKKRNLDTYVVNSCLSACTIIFLSGRNRYITRNAKIGFHQPDFAGLTDDDRMRLARKEELRLQRFGLSAEFAKQATKAPPNEMWTPTPQQLIDERVATKIVDSSTFALSGIDLAEISPEGTDALLRDIPLYAAIARIDAAAYREISRQILDGLRLGKSSGEMMVQVDPVVEELFERTLPHAAPALLTEYTEMTVNHIRLLNGEDPALCYAYMNPQKDSNNLLASFGSKYPGLVEDQNRMRTKVFDSEQRESTAELDRATVDRIVAETFKSIERRFGKDVSLISKQQLSRSEYFSYCNMMAAFYEEILRLPLATRAGVLRTLFQ